MGIAASFQNSYNGLKANVTQSAEMVPESGYGLKPSTMAEVQDLRSGDRPRGRRAVQPMLRGALGMPNPNQGNSFEDDGPRRERRSSRAWPTRLRSATRRSPCSPIENASELIAGGRRRPAGARRRAAGRDRTRQRDVRHLHGLSAGAEHRATLHGCAGARPRRPRELNAHL